MTYTSFEQVLVLGWYQGYIALVCIVATHILLCIFTTVWLLTSVKVSSVGNAWQTITQVASDEAGTGVRVILRKKVTRHG